MKPSSAQRLIPLICVALAIAAAVAAAWTVVNLGDDLDVEAPVAQSFEAFQGDPPDVPVEQAEIPDSPSIEEDLVEEGLVEEDRELPEWEDIDFDALAADQEWEILEPVAEQAPDDEDFHAIGQSRGGPTGRIVVVTNFTRATVTVNGEPYNAYSDDGEHRGMELPANTQHRVLVEFDGKERVYDVDLRPGERRMLMVELTGMRDRSGDAPSPRAQRQQRERPTSAQPDDDSDDEMGRITVYSRPRGEIYVGSRATGEQTPGTVEVEPGRHEVQVEYREGEMSETKTVRVREGSRVKLFFRDE